MVAGAALVTFADCKAALAHDVVPASAASDQQAEVGVRRSAAARPNAVDVTADPASERRSPLRGEVELAGFLATPFEGSGGLLGLGWRMLLGVGWGRIPVTLAFNFQSVYFGEASSRENVGAWNYPLLVDKTRRDTALFFDGVLRVQPPYWPVRPYVEGIFGAKLLQTTYSVSLVGGAGTTDTVSDQAWASTLGVGAGVDLPLLGPNLFLTLGVRLLAGGHASYSRPVSANSDVVIRYDTTTSTMLFALGVSGRLAAPPTPPASR